METKNRIVRKTGVADLAWELKQVTAQITETAAKRGYKILVDGEPQQHIEFLGFKLDHLCKTARKKLAKRIHFAQKNNSLRSFNSLFAFMKRRDITSYKIKVETGDKEKQIQKLRAEYVKLRTQTAAALKAYKEEKGDFYKNQ